MKKTVTVLAISIAVVLQTAVVNRSPLPWGVAPDLVVLTLTAIALRSTPVVAAVTGFCAGLALDALPPADSEIGRNALVLSLAGYLVSALREATVRSAVRPYLVAAGAVLGVSLGFAFVGLVLGDPRVTVPNLMVGVPLTMGMTLAVSPLVLTPLSALLRRLSPEEYELVGASWSSGGGAK
ncbi:MAG: rod shape-determining protein MreD [Nocardiopsaceae bacterium]|nr:rod shape-determining protein MreD [Nocardiopsaceae bacterium]